MKTHEWGRQARQPFTRALLIIRSPYEALQAEFNRRYGGHRGHAPSRWYTAKLSAHANGRYFNAFQNLRLYTATGEEYIYS